MSGTITEEDIPKMKVIEIVADPHRIRILLDETRGKILEAMRRGITRKGEHSYDMTVAEIARDMDVKPQKIYFHIDKLLEHDFIVKSKEEKKKRTITTYYRRTAQSFIISYSDDSTVTEMSSRSREWYENLSRVFSLDLSQDDIDKLIDLSRQISLGQERFIELLSNSVDENKVNIEPAKIFNFIWHIQNILVHSDDQLHETMIQYRKLLLKNLKINGQEN